MKHPLFVAALALLSGSFLVSCEETPPPPPPTQVEVVHHYHYDSPPPPPRPDNTPENFQAITPPHSYSQ